MYVVAWHGLILVSKKDMFGHTKFFKKISLAVLAVLVVVLAKSVTPKDNVYADVPFSGGGPVDGSGGFGDGGGDGTDSGSSGSADCGSSDAGSSCSGSASDGCASDGCASSDGSDGE